MAKDQPFSVNLGNERIGSRDTRKRLILLAGSFAVFFTLAEWGYRHVDPYPYYSPNEINRTEHGNLTEYDARLGWRGTPDAESMFVTQNARTLLRHNGEGHRDIDESVRAPESPAIVFLGDSFTWGYDAEFEDMFVNLMRAAMPDFEVYNLAHRGYGTDQSMMVFEAWPSNRKLSDVFLMFFENDIADNSHENRYQKNKPRYLVKDGKLVLTNVPVPENKLLWKSGKGNAESSQVTIKETIRNILFKSHVLHALHLRVSQVGNAPSDLPLSEDTPTENAWEITRLLIERLDAITRKRGARLCIVRIPSKSETLEPEAHAELGSNLSAIVNDLEISYIDLLPHLQASRLRTYFRDGIHWTPRGHRIAANEILKYLEKPPPVPIY